MAKAAKTDIKKEIVNTFSINPYRLVLKRKILKGFDELNKGNYTYITNLFASDVVYHFEGDHCLGGTRVSRAGVEKWFERLLRLLPSKFNIYSITISGPMWKTRAIMEFTDSVTPQYGSPYVNNGIQVVELSFGVAKKIHTYVDTNKVCTALNVLYDNGVVEAAAPKIEE